MIHTPNDTPHLLLVSEHSESLAPLISVVQTVLQYEVSSLRPQAAMSAAASGRYHNILMDIQQPQLQRQCLTLLKSLKMHFSSLPIIAIVSYADIATTEQAISHGADDYLSQPISIERLKVTLRNNIRLHQLLLQQTHRPFVTNGSGAPRTLRQIEDEVIAQAIQNFDGCITQAARALGIGRSTLYRKLQERLDKAPHQMARENQTTRPITFTAANGDS